MMWVGDRYSVLLYLEKGALLLELVEGSMFSPIGLKSFLCLPFSLLP